jgi:hypothetical protein
MRWPFWLCGIASILIALLVANEPFFWDTIQLGARHALWFYEQDFSTLLLPDDMDSGHIPAFGWYLAACWKLFGQNLLVSHLVMVPWVCLVFLQIVLLARKLQMSNIKLWKTIAFVVLASDATLIAQLSLISPDIILMGAFLWGMNAILALSSPFSRPLPHGQAGTPALPGRQGALLDRRKKSKAVFIQLGTAVILLGLVSLRGMMVAVGLFIWQLYLVYQKGNFSLRETGKTLLPYLPGGCLALFYLAYHYYAKGWIGTHDDSPWAASFASAGGLSLVKQAAIVGWRMVDFGRIFLFLGLLLAWWRSGWVWRKEIKSAVALVLILGVILALPAIVSPGLAQHRYLLPVYLSLAWLLLNVLKEVPSAAWRNGIMILVILGQLTGHLWIYPDTIAQGWDASLAHKPYFEARAAGLDYLQKNAIPLPRVGTTFPEIGPLHWRNLNNQKPGMVPLDFATNTYIWYSNINNDFSDEQIGILRDEWKPVFSFRENGVHLTIYHKGSIQ